MKRVPVLLAFAVAGLLGTGIAVAALTGDGTTTKVAPSFALAVQSSDSAKCDGAVWGTCRASSSAR